jgi:hypothetical protein
VKNSVVIRKEHCPDMLHPNFCNMKKNGDSLINLGDSLNLLKNVDAIEREKDQYVGSKKSKLPTLIFLVQAVPMKSPITKKFLFPQGLDKIVEIGSINHTTSKPLDTWNSQKNIFASSLTVFVNHEKLA